MEGRRSANANSQLEPRFGYDYLKLYIDVVSVRVAQVHKDFLEHQLYTIEFLTDGQVVYETSRRYTEFAAFYEMLLIKFKNIELDAFPSKWQLFKKITHRLEYFNKMMNQLLKFAKDHPEARQKLLACIISFIGPHLEKEVPRENATRKKSGSIGGASPVSDKGEEGRLIKSGVAPSLQELPKDTWSSTPENSILLAKRKEDAYHYIRFEGEYEWKKRYLKIYGSVLEIYKDISVLSIVTQKNAWENKVELYRIRVEYLRKQPDLLDQFMQKMEFQVEMPKYPENYQFIVQKRDIQSIYHDHDCKKLLITTPQASPDRVNVGLSRLYEKLMVASTHSTIRDDYEGYFGSVGKVYFAFHQIKFTAELSPADHHNFWVLRLKTSAFCYDTKQVQTSDTKIKQGVIMYDVNLFRPVSNSFEEFTLELVRVAIEGVISEEIKETVYASGSILMNDMLSHTSDSKFERVLIRLFAVNGPRSNQLATVEATIKNMSDLSSIYSDSYANSNDGRVLNYEKMSNKEILNQLDETIDRLLYVVGCICLFVQTAWRNLYFFKYPRLAVLVFTLLAFAFLLADMNNLILFLVVMLCLAILYNHKWVHAIVNELADKFFTGRKHLHPHFKQPLILSKGQFKYLKWSGNLERIKMEHDAENNLFDEPKRKERFFLLKKGDNEYRVEQERQSLYQKFTEVKTTIQEIHSIINGVVATFEKVASIYSWADFRRTLYFLVFVVLLLVLANAVALRLLGFLFCLHRFKKGYTFYQRHYARNRKLAIEVLGYAINKNFRELYASHPMQKVVPVEELYFPIEEEYLKKLKRVIESLLPVCLNFSQIIEAQKKLQADPKPFGEPYNLSDNPISRYIINKKIKIVYFIDLIESCESRLKLEKLIFAEGRSEDYQKLRENTKEDPVIDIWLEDLVQNYILNSPSKLYTVMARNRHQENNLFGQQLNEQQVDTKTERVLTKLLDNNINYWAAEQKKNN